MLNAYTGVFPRECLVMTSHEAADLMQQLLCEPEDRLGSQASSSVVRPNSIVSGVAGEMSVAKRSSMSGFGLRSTGNEGYPAGHGADARQAANHCKRQ
jgi:hypothetical protein